MAEVAQLQCSVCGELYSPDDVEYTCPVDGQIGTMDVLYDYEALRKSVDRDAPRGGRSMWRWRDLLPISAEAAVPPLRVGDTPFYDAPRLAAEIGIRGAWVKDDGLNPTGSLKDRASALVVARAVEAGRQIVSTASTGNAAAALAGIAASIGMKTIIFVPAAAPEAKIAQLLVYGATVLMVEASYDVAFDLCYDLCLSEGWYCRNTGINPYTVEGKKTVAYEIAEALGWDVPDALIVSVGDGNIIAGVYKGFYDLRELGWIERIPRLIGVQAEGSSPLVSAWQTGIDVLEMQAVEAHTIADSISAGLPRDRSRALRAVRETGGAFVAVTDDEIIASIPRLARLTGVFGEPAAAAVYAGAQRAVKLGLIDETERVVFLSTGSGLKDVKRAQESVAGGLRVPPDAATIRRVLQVN